MNEGLAVSPFDIGLADRPLPVPAQEPQARQLVALPRPIRRQTQRMAQLAVQLGLADFLHSREALKSEVQKIVFALHPDKSGGEFLSDRDKSRFMKARALIGLLDGEGRDGDASDDATALARSTRAIGDGRNLRRSAAAQFRLQMRVLADARRRISGHFAVPKIVSAAVAAALAVTLLTQDAGNNQLLGPWLGVPWVGASLWTLTGLGALAFAVLWWVERSAGKRAEHLLSEAALVQLFAQARSCADRHGRAGKLTAWDMRRATEMLVHGHGARSRALPGWKFLGALDFTTLDRIATIQMQRLIDRRVLRELNTSSIEVLYEVSPLSGQA